LVLVEGRQAREALTSFPFGSLTKILVPGLPHARDRRVRRSSPSSEIFVSFLAAETQTDTQQAAGRKVGSPNLLIRELVDLVEAEENHSLRRERVGEILSRHSSSLT
jgi:hypothetical protein